MPGVSLLKSDTFTLEDRYSPSITTRRLRVRNILIGNQMTFSSRYLVARPSRPSLRTKNRTWDPCPISLFLQHLELLFDSFNFQHTRQLFVTDAGRRAGRCASSLDFSQDYGCTSRIGQRQDSALVSSPAHYQKARSCFLKAGQEPGRCRTSPSSIA